MPRVSSSEFPPNKLKGHTKQVEELGKQKKGGYQDSGIAVWPFAMPES